jgi:hypothetical protein
LKGDVSIQYQAHRDLLGEEKPALQEKIAIDGWGVAYLAARKGNGHWGQGFYQPKWTSSHYSLLDLRSLELPTNCAPVRESLAMILKHEKGQDGGLNPGVTVKNSDVCLNGMALNYCAYFQANEEDLRSIVDFILSQQLPDGGFNCRYNRSGARHSSLHSTLSALEGIHEYAINAYQYRVHELEKAAQESREFILQHRLFKSDKTGEIIDKKFLRLPYPPRWRYDILRAMDYFRAAGMPYDNRMDDALDVIMKKREKDGTWKLYAPYPGKAHVLFEKTGQPSRWNTLRASRVLQYYKFE